MNQPINIDQKCFEIKKPGSPIDVANLNNQVVRLALFEGEYPFHKHEIEDELFFVVKGSFVLQRKGFPDLLLNEGDMFVVEKGIEHRAVSPMKSYVLMFEPQSLKSKGD
ncbi:MAG: cupin domain-containing protein [Candidatus Heimdallarchaeota archaeon]|nr:cupin domain-containing protein [Candidatus Heimdallarchaeota archaeon]MBY8994252.1 cupin domain-containing protein [Candidatus Heimdallarchaeota archaeon]